jgi:SAM-dependent methyltransferase
MSEFDVHAADFRQKIDASIGFSGCDHDFFSIVKAEALCDALPEGADGGLPKVLDIGCGVGVIHPLLKGKVAAITGVDVSEESLKVGAKENTETNFIHYDGSVLPFGDQEFDAAFCICVVHHVPPPSWDAFIAEFHRVLRPGGKAIIIEHNPYNPLTRYVVSRCALDENAVLLSSGRCQRLLAGAGFQDVQTRFISTIPFASSPARALEKLLSPLPFGAQYLTSGTRSV